MRMDVVPISMALAQAAKETGWGHQDLLKKAMLYLGMDLVWRRFKAKRC